MTAPARAVIRLVQPFSEGAAVKFENPLLRKYCPLIVSWLLLSGCAADDIEKKEYQPNPPTTVSANSTLGDLLGMIDADAAAARPVIQCVADSESVDVIESREFSDEEFVKYAPAKSRLSSADKLCVDQWEQRYAESIYRACVEHNCGQHHAEGCQAIQYSVENLSVTVVAMNECGVD